MNIALIHAQELLDSRGNPTVSATVVLDSGAEGTSIVPSGSSKGKYEALELRDNDTSRYKGLGVQNAVTNITQKIFPTLKGKDASDQHDIDGTMIALDATQNKSNLGANAMLAVSLAVARAEARAENRSLYAYLSKFNPDFRDIYTLPLPQMNIINGGKHADWTTDFQEYMIIPISANSVASAVRMGSEVYHALQDVLHAHTYSVLVGDEGGFAPAVRTNEEPLTLLSEAIEKAGYTVGRDIAFGIDAAASEFYADGKYALRRDGKTLTGGELADIYSSYISKFPIVNLEDIFSQDDWESFRSFTASHNASVQIVGDDLYATNSTLLARGIEEKSTNAILIKVNQIGTLTETINTIQLAKKNGFACVVSHRSGETEDTFISDLVVAMGCGQIKTGSLSRSERIAKYNRLMVIEKEVKDKGIMAQAVFPHV